MSGLVTRKRRRFLDGVIKIKDLGGVIPDFEGVRLLAETRLRDISGLEVAQGIRAAQEAVYEEVMSRVCGCEKIENVDVISECSEHRDLRRSYQLSHTFNLTLVNALSDIIAKTTDIDEKRKLENVMGGSVAIDVRSQLLYRDKEIDTLQKRIKMLVEQINQLGRVASEQGYGKDYYTKAITQALEVCGDSDAGEPIQKMLKVASLLQDAVDEADTAVAVLIEKDLAQTPV